ncbi:unnamed protein product [Danaus chrysippus]|uniref:(African queen) hypothetical protein n=1 Tax=Danaus chrysippus TaxID=151541 RepID=A0A8J2QEE4_9NEOP|nr:unnamed protein product [Danaus chrysippus]
MLVGFKSASASVLPARSEANSEHRQGKSQSEEEEYLHGSLLDVFIVGDEFTLCETTTSRKSESKPDIDYYRTRRAPAGHGAAFTTHGTTTTCLRHTLRVYDIAHTRTSISKALSVILHPRTAIYRREYRVSTCQPCIPVPCLTLSPAAPTPFAPRPFIVRSPSFIHMSQSSQSNESVPLRTPRCMDVCPIRCLNCRYHLFGRFAPLTVT